MTTTEIIEQLQGRTPDEKIISLSLLSYDQVPVTDDLLDTDIPAWANVKAFAGASSTTIHIPAGSAYPFVQDYTTLIDIYGETPTPVFYDAPAGDKKQWTDCFISFSGNNLLIWCHTNDGAITSDEMYLILKK